MRGDAAGLEEEVPVTVMVVTDTVVAVVEVSEVDDDRWAPKPGRLRQSDAHRRLRPNG